MVSCALHLTHGHSSLRCRPLWSGNLYHLMHTSERNLQKVVDARVCFQEFRQVSGVAAIDAAIAKLNARLAAKGALPHPPWPDGKAASATGDSAHLISLRAAESVRCGRYTVSDAKCGCRVAPESSGVE